MRKKVLSLLICAAVLFGTMPVISFADETSAQGGAKFGIKRGDIVTFAGSESPIAWRVIDSDKTNTDDTSGMLLLSENTLYNASHSVSSITGLKEYCQDFYGKYFDGFYQSAVMTVSKNDDPYDYNGETYEGILSDDTVFALSKVEAENLSAAERDSVNAMWWLRSVKVGKGWIYGFPGPTFDESKYAHVLSNGKISTTKISNPTNIYLRPAVNIDKTKLAGLDGSPLLLPAGEFTAANEVLAPAGTASEWKLSLKNNDVKIETAYSAPSSNDNLLNLLVVTNLTEVNDNDYISVIIRKKDGSVSYYGRYRMNSTGVVVHAALPSDIDMDNDSMYVFYENYRGVFPGSASDLIPVCIKHDIEYTVTDSRHEFSCKNCTYSGYGDHYAENSQT